MILMTFPFLFALTSELNGCVPVRDEQIHARDVAKAFPRFAALPGELDLGYAPLAGVRRTLTGSSLQTTARTRGIQLDAAPDVCFERPLVPLQEVDVHEAMLNAWDGAAFSIDVRSWGPQTIPEGKLVFPRTGLQLPPASDPEGEVYWRGYVSYGNNHRFSVWARARISTTITRVVAVADIPAGKTIHDGQVRLETCDTVAPDDRLATDLDEVVGSVPRSFIKAGAPILRSQLNKVPDVDKGDTVQVQVRMGGTHLIMEGRAQTPGKTGSTIWVKNLSSGKEFQATVTGRGTVSVGPPSEAAVGKTAQ